MTLHKKRLGFFVVLPFVFFVVALTSAQEQMPRFRAGTNLVRVDAYVSKDDLALTDLKAEDFEVFEDDKPQKIENFELITARRPNPQTERIDPTNVRDMEQQVADAARVFTLFFDRWQVSLSGSYHARKPIVETLDRVIGPDDMVGVMTPEMSPSSMTYSRRHRQHRASRHRHLVLGVARSAAHRPRRKTRFAPAISTQTTGDLAAKMIARLREKQTLDALDDLVAHLEVLRPERKFVMVFTEGWSLFRPDDTSMARVADGRVPSQDAPRVNPLTGGIAKQGDADPRTGKVMTSEACERLRTMLAYSDHETEFRQLLQRANRANVSFYPIDARGLVVFDTPIECGVPPSVDRAWLRKPSRGPAHDGRADRRRKPCSNTNDVSGAMRKVFQDVGSYYLLSYYSTNQKLDGRFRRIRVEVKRQDVDVRSRPGYLAPTEAEARAAGGTITRAGARPAPPPTVTRALDALAPARGNLPVRVQAVGGRSSIRAIVELDAATAKQPEWLSGGTLRLTFEPERTTGSSNAAQSQTLTMAIEPGQRSIVVPSSERPLTAGRYVGSRGADGAKRPSSDPGHDVCHRARGYGGSRNWRSGGEARPEHRTRVRGHR